MISEWLKDNWFEALQTVSIVIGFLFTAYTIRKDEKARKITNLIAINSQHREIWKELYERPKLARVIDETANLEKRPVTEEESLFVNLLILHLNTVYQATKEGLFLRMEGLQEDISEFFALPIPKAVWNKSKRFQDQDFVRFIEANQDGN